MFIAASSTIAKLWKEPRCPLPDGTDKGAVVYIYIMEYYSAITKHEIFPFVMTWMEVETITLSKISQRKKNTI